jgi:hypothetical protein
MLQLWEDESLYLGYNYEKMSHYIWDCWNSAIKVEENVILIIEKEKKTILLLVYDERMQAKMNIWYLANDTSNQIKYGEIKKVYKLHVYYFAIFHSLLMSVSFFGFFVRLYLGVFHVFICLLERKGKKITKDESRENKKLDK